MWISCLHAQMMMPMAFLLHTTSTTTRKSLLQKGLNSSHSSSKPCSILKIIPSRRFMSALRMIQTNDGSSLSNSLKTSPPTPSPWAEISNQFLNYSTTGSTSKNRFRQHVNPLARKYQIPTELPNEWPNDGSFDDPTLPLHIGKEESIL